MTILTIETSTPVCSAAWCIDGQCVAERIQLEGSNHAALLPVFIDELIVEARHHGWQADAVAVSEGPGSYTGLRIGLSTAKGLCYGWHVPLIPIPTLDILSAVAQSHLSESLATLLPMLDARRMEVYMGRYVWDGASCVREGGVEAKVVTDSSWLPEGEIYYFGDGASKCRSLLESEHCHYIDSVVPRASHMGALAERSDQRIMEKQMAYFTPFYLKDFVAAPSHVKGLQ